MISTAIIATIGNGNAFRRGRDWLGVVPEEHITGGKQVLWKIPRRGNQYLSRLFVQGARSVMQRRAKQSPGLSAWLAQLCGRTHRNVAVVALANKLARIAWAVLTRNDGYRPSLLQNDAWQQAWKSLPRFPHSQTIDDEVFIFLPGLLAKKEMAPGSIHHSGKPAFGKGLPRPITQLGPE